VSAFIHNNNSQGTAAAGKTKVSLAPHRAELSKGEVSGYILEIP